MTTPTREQVIAAFSAEFEPMGYEMELAKCQCCTFANERTQDAFMGFTAGREQGLREAGGAVQALHAKVADPIFGQERHDIGHAVIDNCAAAIEQLMA